MASEKMRSPTLSKSAPHHHATGAAQKESAVPAGLRSPKSPKAKSHLQSNEPNHGNSNNNNSGSTDKENWGLDTNRRRGSVSISLGLDISSGGAGGINGYYNSVNNNNNNASASSSSTTTAITGGNPAVASSTASASATNHNNVVGEFRPAAVKTALDDFPAPPVHQAHRNPLASAVRSVGGTQRTRNKPSSPPMPSTSLAANANAPITNNNGASNITQSNNSNNNSGAASSLSATAAKDGTIATGAPEKADKGSSSSLANREHAEIGAETHNFTYNNNHNGNINENNIICNTTTSNSSGGGINYERFGGLFGHSAKGPHGHKAQRMHELEPKVLAIPELREPRQAFVISPDRSAKLTKAKLASETLWPIVSDCQYALDKFFRLEYDHGLTEIPLEAHNDYEQRTRWVIVDFIRRSVYERIEYRRIFHSAVAIFDHFLAGTRDCPREIMELAPAICIAIATKYDASCDLMSMEELIDMAVSTTHPFIGSLLKCIERKILKVLWRGVEIPTAFDFIYLFLHQASCVNPKIRAIDATDESSGPRITGSSSSSSSLATHSGQAVAPKADVYTRKRIKAVVERPWSSSLMHKSELSMRGLRWDIVNRSLFYAELCMHEVPEFGVQSSLIAAGAIAYVLKTMLTEEEFLSVTRYKWSDVAVMRNWIEDHAELHGEYERELVHYEYRNPRLQSWQPLQPGEENPIHE